MLILAEGRPAGNAGIAGGLGCRGCEALSYGAVGTRAVPSRASPLQVPVGELPPRIFHTTSTLPLRSRGRPGQQR